MRRAIRPSPRKTYVPPEPQPTTRSASGILQGRMRAGLAECNRCRLVEQHWLPHGLACMLLSREGDLDATTMLDLFLALVALWIVAFYSGYVTGNGPKPRTGAPGRGDGALGA